MKPGCPFPGVDHVRQRGVATPSGTETVQVVGELWLVIGLQQEADHFADELVAPWLA